MERAKRLHYLLPERRLPRCHLIYPSNLAWLLRHIYTGVHAKGWANVQLISGGLFGHDSAGELLTPAEDSSAKRGEAPIPGIYWMQSIIPRHRW